jgi:hypothetical protein
MIHSLLMTRTSRLVASTALTVIAGIVLLTPTALAQTGNGFLISQNIADGAVLGEPPHVIHMCFAEPVDIDDPDSSDFALVPPGGVKLASRTQFQRNGLGVAIYPGHRPEPSGTGDQPEAEWTFSWMVTVAETGEEQSGGFTFTVEEGGEVIPEEAPPVCLESGETSRASPTTTADPNENGGDNDGDDDSTLLIVLIVAGVASGIAVLGGVGYLVTRRRGAAAGPGPDTPA